ncbi:hypothetical protein ACIG8S_23605 [[Kitasatospora] papulosa]|uniref:hypothetical protein n=1 Tax=Streptomyces TaxID=1883 RepID=UPI002E766C3A|nr:hypothetical protein [Streptomyces sp. JV181]MEE1779444.1 hypothetical protein [Streptomyces sp. JV181]
MAIFRNGKRDSAPVNGGVYGGDNYGIAGGVHTDSIDLKAARQKEVEELAAARAAAVWDALDSE